MKFECFSAGVLVVDHLCSPIKRLPAAGELVLADALPLSIGGCAANVSVNLARLGVLVGAAGCVGNDVLGQFAVDTLRAAAVDTTLVRRLENVATSGTLIINIAGEDRRFIHTPGANARFSVDDLPLDLVLQSRVLYIGGYLLMPMLEQSGALVELFRTARRANVRTVVDVVAPGPGDHWPKFVELLPETDVFLPNTDEARLITGLDEPLAQAQKFRDAGATTVVITQGARGTLLLDPESRLRAGVYPTKFVGGTGAGDAFDSGFIAGMLLGEDNAGCLRWGSALGASCVRSISATESVFDREQALDLMRKHELTIESF